MNKHKSSETVCLNPSTTSIQYLCRVDKRIAKVISMIGEIEYLRIKTDTHFLSMRLLSKCFL